MSEGTFFAGLSRSAFARLAATPAKASETESWIRAELMRGLMRATRGSYVFMLVLVPIMAMLAWGRTPTWQVVAWLLLGLAVAGAHWRGDREYERLQILEREQFPDEPPAPGAPESARAGPPIGACVRRWIASAVLWGLSVLLFFDRTPLVSQFMAWMIVAGAAIYPLSSLALYPPLLRRYLVTLFGGVMAAVAIISFRHGYTSSPTTIGFLLLPLLHGWLLLRAGARIHQTVRHSFELLFQNHILIHSLTQQRQAAVAAVATKDRFLASAAHDMRQPVLALSLYADWLRNEPELALEIAPKIVRATEAVNTLFDSLFDLARIDAGQVRLHIEPVDMVQVLHDLELQYRPLAESKGLRFRIRSRPGVVFTDPIRVRRMVGNLLANAIKYTNRGGVLLAVRRGAEGLRVEVWDTGVGIPPEFLREIFLEFYKVADNSGTSDGFGLGLAIVARLSRVLGHPVRVHSRVGRGSMFRILLHDADPVAQAAQARLPGTID